MNDHIPQNRIIPTSLSWVANIGGALLLAIIVAWVGFALWLMFMRQPTAFEPLQRSITWELRR